MTDKERLEDIKNSHLRGIHSLFGTPWVSMPKENFDWLIQQAEHRQKLLERLNKRGIEVRKLKSKLSQCREKIKKLEWNLFVMKGTAEQSMRANESNHELTNKLEEENKRLREVINNIIEKAMLFGTNEEVYEAIQDAIKELEGEK